MLNMSVTREAAGAEVNSKELMNEYMRSCLGVKPDPGKELEEIKQIWDRWKGQKLKVIQTGGALEGGSIGI